MSFAHASVLREEVVALLRPKEGAVILDCTLGAGGHSEAFLEEGATVWALDRDPAAQRAASKRLERFGTRFHAQQGNFRDARALLDSQGLARVDGLLADLGVSSPQLDDAQRGFSFSRPGPLDMRMGPDAEPLSSYLARTEESDLARAIREFGEEPNARRIAKAVKSESFSNTAELAAVIAAAIPRKAWPRHIHPATRTFQALRIAVNGELLALEALLTDLPDLVSVGGRAAFISFHSLEDRRVKEAFRALAPRCICPPHFPVCACGRPGNFEVLTRKPISASPAEIAQNPRARSAKLRAVERVR